MKRSRRRCRQRPKCLRKPLSPSQTTEAAETLPTDYPSLAETTDNAAEAAAEITPGLFTALSDLLGDSTLLMTVAPTGEADRQPVLTVTVVPQGEEDAFSPVCLTGTVARTRHPLRLRSQR